MIVLDTHVWIWLVNGDDSIKKAGFLNIINRNASASMIRLPAICLWEAAMLVAKNRIVLSENTREWIEKASAAPGISVYPLTSEVAYDSSVLPGIFHGDPADRMIVATARILNAPLLTIDRAILDYAGEGYLKVINPKKV